VGGKTIFDDYLREVRPRYQPLRTYQRTVYRPGELCQFDLWEPRAPIPVGHGQLRRGWVVTAELGFSRAIATALVFSKELRDLRFGMSRCLGLLGALPSKLVWDREGAIHRGGGRPTEGFAAFCGALPVGWIILDDVHGTGLERRLLHPLPIGHIDHCGLHRARLGGGVVVQRRQRLGVDVPRDHVPAGGKHPA
jgi:hypothetical protein